MIITITWMPYLLHNLPLYKHFIISINGRVITVNIILDTVHHLKLKTHSVSEACSLDLTLTVSYGLTTENLPLSTYMKTEAQPASKTL